jgi:hypothetical protein
MPRSVDQILGLLGTRDVAAVRVHLLDAAGEPPRAAGWDAVWGADFGRLTASVTAVEKDALIAAGAHPI